MPSNIKVIKERYAEFAQKYGLNENLFPYKFAPDGFGGYHVEIGNTGKLFLVSTERGQEFERKETNSIDELMYWLFSGYAYSDGWDYELKNRHPKNDSRRIVFPKALEAIEKISPEWRDRLKAEQDEILKNNPFVDNN